MVDGKWFPRQEGQQVPEMTPEIVNSISRHMELFEHITGENL